MPINTSKVISSYPREDNEQMKARKTKLKKLREAGISPYADMPSSGITHYTSSLSFLSLYHQKTREELASLNETHSMSGRIMAIRQFGKAAFLQIQDREGSYQAYVSQKDAGDKLIFSKNFLEVGDIVHTEGAAMKTKTDETTLKVADIKLLTKSIRPLPEKFHGLTDIETRYRQRYLDLIMTQKTRHTFVIRTKVIHAIRNFFVREGFMEVETPMMHPIAGGAIARPFKTYRNTLHRELYMRIAPELYLKRLLVGGMERVFEINRNFRNEGISTQHNPEFTMLEFYAAHMHYQQFMNLTEQLFIYLCEQLGIENETISYQGQEISLKPPFARMTLKQAIVEHTELNAQEIENADTLHSWLKNKSIDVSNLSSLGYCLVEIFDRFVEDKLISPTFITAYPVEVSPLAKRNPDDPSVTDRFELFICGREIANAFNELNDPDEQYARFCEQALRKEQGDEEACSVDLDYIRALEYGLPPAAGEGIGIDRLVMLLSDSPSIRDVILFPLLKEEKG